MGHIFSKIRLTCIIKSNNVSETQYKHDMINLSVPKIPHCGEFNSAPLYASPHGPIIKYNILKEVKKLVFLVITDQKKSWIIITTGIQKDLLIVSKYKT